ncbi:hypothetical protein O6H91_Y149900 [Diphasiastrum complanatum]|nr:hypothetical protein O6H91_Y149900 [Diphasiastrum complanatum]
MVTLLLILCHGFYLQFYNPVLHYTNSKLKSKTTLILQCMKMHFGQRIVFGKQKKSGVPLIRICTPDAYVDMMISGIITHVHFIPLLKSSHLINRLPKACSSHHFDELILMKLIILPSVLICFRL